MNAEVIGQAVLFQAHVDGKVEQQFQQKCCLPNEVALNEKGKLRKLYCKHLADCKHNCHGETTPQDRSHSKNKDSLAPVSSPSLLNRYNSRRVYITCVGVVHFAYPILIIISEQRDTLPTIRRPEFMNFGTPQNPLNPFRPQKNNLGKRATKTFTKIPIPSTKYSNRMMITHIFDQCAALLLGRQHQNRGWSIWWKGQTGIEWNFALHVP